MDVREPGLDVFGTKQIYPTAPAGHAWSSKWSGHPRTLVTGQFDPDDGEFFLEGSNQSLQVLGDGTARSRGDQVRMHIGDPTGARRWLNTELTLYAMQVSEAGGGEGAGIEVQLRTANGHTLSTALDGAGLPLQCAGKAYGFALRPDGRAFFEKELRHPFYTGQVSRYGEGEGAAMPKRAWIGMKAIVYDVPAGVKLEIWRDRTDGANGGTWEMIHEYTDAGGWSVDPAAAASCGIPPDLKIQTPMPLVILRADAVSDQRFKKVSVREIRP